VIGDVRGRGLMLAIELVVPGGEDPDPATAGRLLEETRQRGLLVGKGGLHGNVIRMAPPMTLTDDEAHEALDVLAAAFDALGG
jgi:4-aminobutyrate aminotransferase